MPTPDIIEKVRQLRTQLDDAQPSAPVAPHVATAIDSVLDDPTHARHYVGLRDRLLSASADLETSHPQLAASIHAVLDALNSVGI